MRDLGAMSHPDPNGPADRTPIETGEVWDNPVTGERATILERPWDNPAGRGTGELTALVGARVMGEHRHPTLVEKFTVLEGELTVKCNGKTSILSQSETTIIERNVWHDWWNASERDARVRVEVWRAVPAHDRNLLRPRAARARRPEGHAESAATGAECAGVQRHNRVPFATAGSAARHLWCARTDRALARLSRGV